MKLRAKEANQSVLGDGQVGEINSLNKMISDLERFKYIAK